MSIARSGGVPWQKFCVVGMSAWIVRVSFAPRPKKRFYGKRLNMREGIVKLLGMMWSPGNNKHFPEAMSTDPTLRRLAPYR